MLLGRIEAPNGEQRTRLTEPNVRTDPRGCREKGWIEREPREAHPERFVNKRPVPPSAPMAVWINKPKLVPVSEEKIH